MQRQLHLRSQHAKRGRSGFSGPDTYVAVTIAPEGVEVPKYLNRSVLDRRGIQIRYNAECGGYFHGHYFDGLEANHGDNHKEAIRYFAGRLADLTAGYTGLEVCSYHHDCNTKAV